MKEEKVVYIVLDEWRNGTDSASHVVGVFDNKESAEEELKKVVQERIKDYDVKYDHEEQVKDKYYGYNASDNNYTLITIQERVVHGIAKTYKDKYNKLTADLCYSAKEYMDTLRVAMRRSFTLSAELMKEAKEEDYKRAYEIVKLANYNDIRK